MIPVEKMNAAARSIDNYLTAEDFPKNAWIDLKEIWQGMNEELPPWFLGLLFCLFYLSVMDCIRSNGNYWERRQKLREERSLVRYRARTKKLAKKLDVDYESESESELLPSPRIVTCTV